MEIETQRLLLRPLSLEDANEMLALNRDPDVRRFISGASMLDRPRVLERIRQDRLDWAERGYGLMTMLERASGRYVGRSGLKYWPEFEETEVGWTLRADARGQGFATEAGQACVEWGFGRLTVPYLTALIRSDNEASIKVAQRLEMAPLRSDFLGEQPVIVYAIRRPSTT